LGKNWGEYARWITLYIIIYMCNAICSAFNKCPIVQQKTETLNLPTSLPSHQSPWSVFDSGFCTYITYFISIIATTGRRHPKSCIIYQNIIIILLYHRSQLTQVHVLKFWVSIIFRIWFLWFFLKVLIPKSYIQ